MEWIDDLLEYPGEELEEHTSALRMKIFLIFSVKDMKHIFCWYQLSFKAGEDDT